MIKSITYYLEDPNRLDDVSLQDLAAWIEEAPYSQPLHKLMDLKVKRAGKPISDVAYQNAAYHNADLDLNNGLESNMHIVIDQEEEVPLESDDPKGAEAEVKQLGSEQQEVLARIQPEEHKQPALKVVSHSFASDDLEDGVEEEVQELLVEIPDYSYVETVVETNHDIENITKGVGQIENLTITYEKADVQVISVVKDEAIDIEVEHFIVEPEVIAPLVDDHAVEDLSLVSRKRKNKKGRLNKAKTNGELKNPFFIHRAKAKAQSKSKSKSEATKGKKVNKKKSDKAKDLKVVLEQEVAKEVRYVYLDNRQESDYRIHEYKGESDYIRWLMGTKSINKERTVADKKKKKKAKKSVKKAVKEQKKSKGIKKMVLKAAEQSVKKRDVIISETLADILAMQGHAKKAKKMYKQLSLIFPEKSSFFAAKIKKLKKK